LLTPAVLIVTTPVEIVTSRITKDEARSGDASKLKLLDKTNTQLIKGDLKLFYTVFLFFLLTLSYSERDEKAAVLFSSVIDRIERIDGCEVSVRQKLYSRDNEIPDPGYGEFRVTIDGNRVLIDARVQLASKNSTLKMREVRTLIDEPLVYQYLLESETVNIDSVQMFPSFGLGDPRLFSLSQQRSLCFSSVKRSLSRFTKIDATESIEGVNGGRTKFVFFDNAPTSQIQYKLVLEVDKRFRVWNTEYSEVDQDGKVVWACNSVYSDQFANGDLPVNVEHHYSSFKSDGEALRKRKAVYELSDYSKRKGGLARENLIALNLNVGADVRDMRINETIGYWSDSMALVEGLVQQTPGLEPANSKRPSTGIGFWVFICLGVGTLSVALYLWFKGFR
jgi:hypothetical protein